MALHYKTLHYIIHCTALHCIYNTLHYTLHCVALHYITLYISLHCIALHYITLHYIMHCTELHYIIHCTALHCITLHYTLHCIALHYSTLHYTLHCIALQYITLYIALHCITLRYIFIYIYIIPEKLFEFHLQRISGMSPIPFGTINGCVPLNNSKALPWGKLAMGFRYRHRTILQWIGLRENFNRKAPWLSWDNLWFPVKIFPTKPIHWILQNPRKLPKAQAGSTSVSWISISAQPQLKFGAPLWFRDGAVLTMVLSPGKSVCLKIGYPQAWWFTGLVLLGKPTRFTVFH